MNNKNTNVDEIEEALLTTFTSLKGDFLTSLPMTDDYLYVNYPYSITVEFLTFLQEASLATRKDGRVELTKLGETLREQLESRTYNKWDLLGSPDTYDVLRITYDKNGDITSCVDENGAEVSV